MHLDKIHITHSVMTNTPHLCRKFIIDIIITTTL